MQILTMAAHELDDAKAMFQGQNYTLDDVGWKRYLEIVPVEVKSYHKSDTVMRLCDAAKKVPV